MRKLCLKINWEETDINTEHNTIDRGPPLPLLRTVTCAHCGQHQVATEVPTSDS